MAKVIVNAGVCGEIMEASAESVDKRYVKIKIGKCCEFVERMKPALESEPLDGYKLMTTFESSDIYKAANKCLPHVTCPVPSGLHKLIEVALDLAISVDVSIKIEK